MKKLALAAVLCGVAYSSFAATPVRIETNMGNIDLVLDEKKAPITVKNFVSYANKGHYNGYARIVLQNTVGTIAMARTAAPYSSTSQFFPNTANNTPLNYKGPTPAGAGYAVFGRVTGGMNVVNAISKVRTTSKGMHQDVPASPIVIKKVTVFKTQ